MMVYAIILVVGTVGAVALATYTENHDPFHIKEKAEKEIKNGGI